MFNINSIGRRVTSQLFGEGCITEFDGTSLPIKVVFDEPFDDIGRTVLYYTSEGVSEGFVHREYGVNDNIQYYYNKQGTPEARKIVAMLATSFRNTKRYSHTQEEYERSEFLYKTAKQLLTKLEK